jgi:hypothetical protein
MVLWWIFPPVSESAVQHVNVLMLSMSHSEQINTLKQHKWLMDMFASWAADSLTSIGS